MTGFLPQSVLDSLKDFPDSPEEFFQVPASVKAWRAQIVALHKIRLIEWAQTIPNVEDEKFAAGLVEYVHTRRLHLNAGNTADEIIGQAKQEIRLTVEKLHTHFDRVNGTFDWSLFSDQLVGRKEI